MEAILKYLSTLSASQRLTWVGSAGMAVSAVSTGIFGYQIAEGMQLYVFGGSLVMSIIGWYGNQKDKERTFKLKIADAELREAKIEAGMNPDLDKTIIRSMED
jgi:hypothetical protein